MTGRRSSPARLIGVNGCAPALASRCTRSWTPRRAAKCRTRCATAAASVDWRVRSGEMSRPQDGAALLCRSPRRGGWRDFGARRSRYRARSEARDPGEGSADRRRARARGAPMAARDGLVCNERRERMGQRLAALAICRANAMRPSSALGCLRCEAQALPAWFAAARVEQDVERAPAAERKVCRTIARNENNGMAASLTNLRDKLRLHIDCDRSRVRAPRPARSAGASTIAGVVTRCDPHA